MDRKKKIISASIIIIILIVIIILFLIFNPFGKRPNETAPPADQNGNQASTAGKIDLLPPPSAARIQNEKDYPLGLESLTSSYAERFASYSSDADFKNLDDLKILSTSKMQAFIDGYMATSQIGQNGYELQEAKALNNQLIYLSQDKALVAVSLQLTKFQGEQANPTTSYSKVELTVLKNRDEWKVDEANWK